MDLDVTRRDDPTVVELPAAGPGAATVPYLVAAQALDGAPPRTSLVAVGRRAEVSLAALPAAQASACADYLQACLRLWAGEQRAARHTRRLLVWWRQHDRGRKVDLGAVSAALDVVGALSAAVHELTGADPDHDAVVRLAGSGARLDVDGATSRLVVDAEPGPHWPPLLGGPSLPSETGRRVEVVVNHASWRQRRTRRLVQVRCWALEVWPD